MQTKEQQDKKQHFIDISCTNQFDPKTENSSLNKKREQSFFAYLIRFRSHTLLKTPSCRDLTILKIGFSSFFHHFSTILTLLNPTSISQRPFC